MKTQKANRWQKLTPRQQEAEKAKKKTARQTAKSKKAEKMRQLKWKALTNYSMVLDLEGLHNMAKRQRSTEGGGPRGQEMGSGLGQNQGRCQEYFWGGKSLEEVQNGQ